MKNVWKYVLLVGCSIIYAGEALSLNFSYLRSNSHFVLEAGANWSEQGKNQHIDIESLIGDDFTVDNRYATNALVGLGYFLDIPSIYGLQSSLGINAFYFPDATVSGDVIQESLFNNLSYHYKVSHVPVYAEWRLSIPTKSDCVSLTTNLGIGANFMRTGQFVEHSLDGGVTIPDDAFSARTHANFSATAGIGIQWDNMFGHVPLECGYRFFYLGSGHLNKKSDQIVNTLSTGTVYANAILCTVRV